MPTTQVTIEQINKVNVSMSQKINMGNYETRDFFVAVEIMREPKQEMQDIVAFGKELCAKEVGDYYKEIKKKLNEPEEEVPEIKDVEHKDVYAKIIESENVEQLNSLIKTVGKLPEGDSKDAITKAFNRKKIQFDADND